MKCTEEHRIDDDDYYLEVLDQMYKYYEEEGVLETWVVEPPKDYVEDSNG